MHWYVFTVELCTQYVFLQILYTLYYTAQIIRGGHTFFSVFGVLRFSKNPILLARHLQICYSIIAIALFMFPWFYQPICPLNFAKTWSLKDTSPLLTSSVPPASGQITSPPPPHQPMTGTKWIHDVFSHNYGYFSIASFAITLF